MFILPIMCNSWLLYPPYREIFREDTNTGIFVRNFNIIKIKEDEVFKSDWIIFNKKYQGILEGLPNNTSMRRGFIEYIKQGKSFGSAIGLLLFDGERCIIR